MEHNQGTLMSRLYKFTLCNLFQKAVTKLEKKQIYTSGDSELQDTNVEGHQ